MKHGIEQIGNELLARPGQTADFLDLPLQLRSRSSLAVGRLLTEQLLDWNLQGSCQGRDQGGRQASSADLVGSEHRLGNLQGVGDLLLGQAGFLASLCNALPELTEELGLVLGKRLHAAHYTRTLCHYGIDCG